MNVIKRIIPCLLSLSALYACGAKKADFAKVHSATNQERAFSPTAANATSHISSQYGGANKDYDSQLLTMREKITPRFKVLQFNDPETGITMDYNLFIPADYDTNKRYPLVLFMADASTVSKGVEAPLKQGYGGIIWASEESQTEHPCFVLVPSYKGPESATNDAWQVSAEVPTTYHLLQSILKNYSIDQGRIYTTGQSMGGMISFYLNVEYPELFTASLFVGSLWDTAVLSPLSKKPFLYIVSAADPKASKGMNELGTLLKSLNTPYAEVEFSAKLPQEEQNAIVSKLLAEGRRINFIRFSPNTVVPDSMNSWKGGEHMYSFDYAYLLKPARDWLFQQSK